MMSHPFGDLLSQHLHRKHGLSQSKLAAGILQDPAVIGKMCKGQRLSGPQARERVLAIIGWLREQAVLTTVAEANALLEAAGMASLRASELVEAALLRQLRMPMAPTPPPATAALRMNLPTPLTSFIGRSRELAEVQEIVAKHRLVTLTGAGGCGKTRLALAVAEHLMPVYSDGVFFVPLAPIAEPALIAPAIAGSVGLSLQGGAEPHIQLCDFLRHKEPLLVIDNVEHLLPKVELLTHLLQQAPRLRLLVTSREPLHLYGESTYSLAGLLSPQQPVPEEIGELDAVRLFIQSAQRADATFQLQARDLNDILHICRLVDGLPLGIELAASWVRLLSCAEISAELARNVGILTSHYTDVPERHRSLSAVIKYSWDLLTQEEQEVLRAFGVFRGGCERSAAEQVAGANLIILSSLVDKSLLQRDASGRYTLHEVVRQFAQGQLLWAQQEAQTRDKHLAYYLALAEAADRELSGAAQLDWFQRLEAEHDNLRAALLWCRDMPDRLSEGLRLAGTLPWFWFHANHWREGRQWAEQFLQRSSPEDCSEDRAKALFAGGALAIALEDVVAAQQYLPESLSIFRTLGNRVYIARSLCVLGIMYMYQGDYEQAHARAEESLPLFRAGGDQPGYLFALEYLGQIILGMGDYPRAYAVFQECLALNQQMGSSISLPQTLIDLARVERCLSDLDSASEHLQACLSIASQFGILRVQAQALCNLGWIALKRSAMHEANTQFVKSLRLYRQLASGMGIAEALEGLASVSAALADWEHTAVLLGAAEALRKRIGVSIPIENRALCTEVMGLLKQQLTSARFSQCLANGQHADLEKLMDDLLV